MAFSVATFKTRALTAVVFVIIMLAGLLLSKWSFILLFIIIHFGCWYEFINLIKKIHPYSFRYYLPAGIFYITMPVLMMLNLSLQQFPNDTGEHLFFIIPCGIIFSIWINDTMAYLVGSFIGKTPFSKISPKKTWEGTAGGAILCVLVIGCIIAPLAYSNRASDVSYFLLPWHWFIIAAICAVFGTLGDLLESKLKRMAAVKDSGTFMPGHGGFLDRFDSLLIATPFVWFYITFFAR